MIPSKWFIGASIILFLCATLLYVGASRPYVFYFSPHITKEDIADETFWREVIRSKGGIRAYEKFSRAIIEHPQTTQHTAAHAFGGALYGVEHVGGLSVCDDRFSYGCFHEFLGRAIADLGLSSVSSLNESCFSSLGKKGLACQHGIGHGIIAAIGYDYENMKEALEVCKTLPYSDPIGGCYGGVFMEYNLRTMLGEEGRPREKTEGLLSPCDTLRDVFVPACAYNAPQWWSQVVVQGSTSTNAFERLGLLCEELGAININALRPCFEGVGTYIPVKVGYSPEQTIALCRSAARTSQEEEWCRSAAASAVSIEGGGSEDGLKICEGLEEESYKYCAGIVQKRLPAHSGNNRPI